MPKNKQAAGEEFARPFWDVVRDVEDEYSVHIETQLALVARKGVLEVRMLARRLEDRVDGRPCAVVAQEWPNATYQSLPAMLYSLAFKLGRMVEETRLDDGLSGRLR